MNLNLARTAEALRAYDQHTGGPHPITGVDPWIYDLNPKVQELAEAVGVAFGHDTADRNSMDTCKSCVRPGPWLRNLVRIYNLEEGR